MTQEEVESIYERLNKMADDLTEFCGDILILVTVEHEPDEENKDKTRQLLYVGRGNYWARLGMCQDFIGRCAGGTVATSDTEEEN